MTPARSLITLAACAAAFTATAQTPMPAASATAKAALKATTAPGAQGVSGDFTLSQRGTLVVVEGTVRGLVPNTEHGFHVHENADCSGDGKAAGDHFNPDRNPHAHPGQKMRHPGAMFNLRADANGVATFRQEVDTITLAPGKYSVAGKPLVVHAKPDDYASQPSGDAGDRIACGLIG
jgi:Cu-Zn family superoxide dismutase